MASKKMYAVLEIYHDSDQGPNNIDFKHTITLYNQIEYARNFIDKRQNEIMQSDLAKNNKCILQDDDIVFESDDWYRWEIKEVEVPE
jgi:hypothetical protein